MQFFTGTPANLKSTLMVDIARYRHKVFVEKLGWSLQCENGLEYDQFDRHDTVYVTVQDDQGEIVGTARLLPTTGPYLLEEVFPQLLNGLPPPSSKDVWELSRFAAVDLKSNATSAMGQFSSPIAVALLRACVKYVADCQATRLVSVSPLGVERLLKKAGFNAHRFAPPQIVNGTPLLAVSISVD